MSPMGTGSSDTATEEATDRTPAPSRRHDLDALRGFAMLLGIGLHASLSFFPAFWAVQDSKVDQSGFYDEFFHSVHGFRMPVFFLLSGFFTTMLWRRRGLGSLIRQRVTRVLVPLAIGLVTIVPIMNSVVDESVASPDIVTAIVVGDVEGVQRFVDDGYELEARGEDGGTILHLAALLGTAEVVEALLDAGADPDAVTHRGDTPLGAAFVFGNEAAADLLVEYGAPDERLPGQDWSDIEGWGFLADEIEAPKDEREGPASWVESFHHLWFLWFLCFLVAGFVVVAWISESMIPARGRERLLSERVGHMVLIALMAVTWLGQFLMGGRGDFRVFGPDTSTGVDPDFHVIGYYAIFFAFGALMYDRRGRDGAELADTFGRRWGIVLPITIVILLPFALYATFGDGSGGEPWPWAIASMLQAIYAWAMIFGLMGFFRAVLVVERRGVRYLSDSSYWLYLAHLPLIIAGQAWIRNWNIPASVKFLGLCVVSTALLLASYQLFVRYTPIGRLLNGPRSPTRFRIPWAGEST